MLQCVFDVDSKEGLELLEISEGVSVDDIKAATGCTFKVSQTIYSYIYKVILYCRYQMTLSRWDRPVLLMTSFYYYLSSFLLHLKITCYSVAALYGISHTLLAML